MNRTVGWTVAAMSGLMLLWFSAEIVNVRRYPRPTYEVESVDAVTYAVQIPKGWRKTDFSDRRESTLEFTTSTTSIDRNDPYFVLGALDIEDHGPTSVEAVVAEWRRGQGNSEVAKKRLGEIETLTWTSELPMVELSGEARTFVFRGENGRVYSAHYQLASERGPRARQDYVFGRILASMKFKP